MEKNRRRPHSIPGTTIINNKTLWLISSGIPSLDDVYGGGLGIGTVTLVEEDTYGLYSKVMLQYFLAEGVVNDHCLYIASQECDPTSFIKKLPAPINNDLDNLLQFNSNDSLTIAWRYQHLQIKVPKPQPTFGHNYDLTKLMDDVKVGEADISYWKVKEEYPSVSCFKNPAYYDLIKNIEEVVTKKEFLVKANPEKRNILRIVIHSAGSPLWLPNGDDCNSTRQKDLEMFFYCLRSLARSALVVIVVTVPSKVISQETLSRCIHSSDYAVRLAAFAGTELEKNPALSDYQGFFQFLKFPTLNCLRNDDPGPTDFVFKMRRKKFVIEILHLPPDIQDPSSDVPVMGCSTSSKNLLDF